MQYEAIILELMSRIKNLENEVEEIKRMALSNSAKIKEDGEGKETRKHVEMTEKMMIACYDGAKKFLSGEALEIIVDQVVTKTDMNRNSAKMYINVVKSMLRGEAYGASISSSAVQVFFELILKNDGKDVLEKAINSTRGYLSKKYGNDLTKGKKILKLCDEFERKV